MTPDEQIQSKRAAERAFVEGWRRAGPELERIRRDELRALNDRPYYDWIEDLLQLGSLFAAPETTSGLVEQQRIFMKARR
jgi:hypothetical protein